MRDEIDMIERVLNVIDDNENMVRVLQHAVRVEEEKIQKYSKDYPEYTPSGNPLEVHANRAWIEKLVIEEIVELAYKSSKHTDFRLVDREAVKRALEVHENMSGKEVDDSVDIPDDLFDDVVGYDDLKEMFMKAIKTGGVHFLTL